MASVSEQEGVEAMLGLGAATVTATVDDGPDDDDMDEGGPSGALVKVESSDVVR